MIVCLLVLSLHEQGPGEFEPYAQEPGIPVENPPKDELGMPIIACAISTHSTKKLSFNGRIELSDFHSGLRVCP
jgi:hypothetical protein